eukprot:1055536-Pyramimonas_sp.AAC.1
MSLGSGWKTCSWEKAEARCKPMVRARMIDLGSPTTTMSADPQSVPRRSPGLDSYDGAGGAHVTMNSASTLRNRSVCKRRIGQLSGPLSRYEDYVSSDSRTIYRTCCIKKDFDDGLLVHPDAIYF